MLPLILLGTMLILMLMRVAALIGRKVEGRTLKEVRLSFRERLLLQRVNIYAIGAALLLGALGGWVSTIFEVLVVLMAFAILLIPAKYIFTSEGIALNNTLFRRWNEFTQFSAQGARVQLLSQQRLGRFTLYVPAREQPEVLKVVKKHIAKSVGKG